ncbi:MAG: DUF2339 domain-containing protein [Planctomycetes bacterium]|nr:DUF2339 domain-containing protein [Planctomycetota bacterium]
MCDMTLIVILSGLAFVISLVAIVRLKANRDDIKRQNDRLFQLAQDIKRLKELSDLTSKKGLSEPSEAALEKPPLIMKEEERVREIPVSERVEVPEVPSAEELPEVAAVAPVETPIAEVESKIPEVSVPTSTKEYPPSQPSIKLTAHTDREKWSKLEEKLGKQWMTWVGAVVLFLSAAFFVKYAFEHGWLTEWGRVILGIIAGIVVVVFGERFLRREMRSLGQGLIGAGLAILYVSLYAAYGFYELLPQPITFVLLAIVAVCGMVLAIIHNAIAISFLALLGGFLTPLLLRTGRDSRDALFAYIVLLDLGVLGVAFFKRWRMLDILAFVGTWALFTGWYLKFHNSPTFSIVPTLLWLAAIYVIFLLQPFVYHLRLATPIVGERFFLAVSNAAGMFGWVYAILHPAHKHALGFITLGMSISYLVLGSLTRKRLRNDERAVFGFIAMSIMFLTIAIPIHLDFHGVTVAWAVKAPVLLYLAYKYSYFPVRAGVLISLALAAGRIFTIHWPLHEEPFVLLFNKHFGTAIFVSLAGGAYTLIHHFQRNNSSVADRILKICTGIASAFLVLVIIHIEVWQWLELSGRGLHVRWITALIWAVGSVGFLAAGLKLRSIHSRFSGFVALLAAGALVTWDYGLGVRSDYLLIFNGRFVAAFTAIIILFLYAFIYRCLLEQCNQDEKRLSIPFYGAGIILLTVLASVEIWQWLAFHGHHYLLRCILPFLWVAGSASYLGTGIRLRSFHLRIASLATLTIAGILAGIGYIYRIEGDYTMFFNGRFAASIALPFMVFIYAFTLRRLRDIRHQSEEHISEALYGVGIFLLVLLVSVETWLWLGAHDHDYLARCLVPLIWVAGAAGYLGTGIRLRSTHLRSVGLAVLSVAGILAASSYKFDMDSNYFLYLNGRMLVGLAVVLMVFAHGFILRCFRNLCKQDEQIAAKSLYGIGTVLLFILLSVETYLYFLGRIADPERARWVAQMSLSVVWGVYAIAVLAAGFWRKVRSLRLSALGLFGLTALKLVIIDMAKVEEVYRIVSFLVLGILMIGASYLYHRVEKRLTMSSEGKD